MGDKALRGKGLLGVGRQPPKEEMDPTESLGVMVTGGRHVGKPHSTKEGRIASGKRNVGRFFSQFKKKKGTPV